MQPAASAPGHELTHGERLLIRAVRLLGREAPCHGLQAQFVHAGAWGAEAYRALQVFLAQLSLCGRRRVTLSVPGDAALTADEALILDLFGCAQAEDYRTLDARLARLADAEPPASLGAAACLTAQALGLSGYVLRPRPAAGGQCCEARTTPRSTAAQWAPAAATT